MAIELGLTGSAEMTVTEEATARADGTGDVPVLSTPMLLLLMQQATVNALAGRVPEDLTTVAMRVNVDHLHGSRIGTDVRATATLIRIEGRRLVFEADATSGDTLVGTGRIIRVQIDRAGFLDRVG